MLRSTDVLAVWADRGNVWELVLDVVGVADVMDQFRMELDRGGISSSSSNGGRGSEVKLFVRG